jgi:hypothetical protein
MATRNSKKPSIKQAIEQAKVAEDTVPVCLRGDLVKAVERLEQQRIEILANGSDSLVPPDTSEVDKQIAELQEEQGQATFEFRLRELSYRRWDQIETAHPPRDGRLERVNAATFLPAVVRASVVEPKLDDQDWNDLLGVRVQHPGDCKLDVDTDNEACACREPVLSKSQFGRLADAAISLNSSKDAAVPFGAVASMIRQLSASG